jgi:hypothetical protein
MADAKVKLLRPLDGKARGDEATYPEADAERLERLGAVRIVERPRRKAANASGDAFDHDGDGRPGGSRKGAQSTRAKGAARRKSRA